MSEINLPNSRGFAWEFLRHNPVYREHACGCSDLSSSAGYLPQNWGLLRFEDPDIPASGANIFWSERACSSILWASLAEPGSSDAAYSVVPDENAFGLSICHDCHGRSHHLFKTADGHFQIILGEAEYAKGHALLFHLPWFGPFQTHLETIRSFIAAVDKRRPGFVPSPVQKPTIAIRNRHIQLIALDGFLAGKSLREIAEDVYTKDQVDSTWNDPRQHMKDRVRKIIKRAVARMNGGYLDLLRPPRDRLDPKRYTTNGRNIP